jgi:hypothetical protein
MSFRLALAAAVLLPALALAPGALATPSARLVYSRGAGAESCPDEAALRHAVASRVGYDPFFPWAEKTVVATVLRAQPRGFVASVHLVDSAGVEHGARELRTDDTCAELLDAAALAIAIAIDPLLLAARAPASVPEAKEPDASPKETRPAAPSPSASRAAESTRARERSSVALGASAGAVASLGVAPGPAVGLSLGADARWDPVSLGVEGRIDAPASRRTDGLSGTTFSSWLVTATLAPCLHFHALLGCALAQLGSLQASADVGAQATAPWLAAGVRAGVILPVGSHASLRLRADLLGNLDRVTMHVATVDGVTQWKAPLFTASYGLEVAVPFL